MSLYQKYRPKDFSSLVWQEFVKIALSNALSKHKTVWAYLFYGSRWTGKTTVARILAKAVNCLNLKEDWNPCLECENCKAFENGELLDIIEIDAASNTWVDNIRDLIEKSQFQPNQSKFKVYIIDEVHMLSKWAFNALLKTLEEPPSHVKFILATTELHKIPDTIISRTQRYDFKKISDLDIVERLKYIAHNEWISVEMEALDLIARLSRWWLRDAIAFFEQYSIWWNLKLDYLKENLQLVGDEFLEIFAVNLINKDIKWVKENLEFLKWKWIDVKIFLEEMTFFLHTRIIDNLNIANIFNENMELYDMFLDIYSKLKTVPNTFLLLEYSTMKFLLWENKIIESNDNIPKQAEKPKIETIKIEKKIENKKEDIEVKKEVKQVEEIFENEVKEVKKEWKPFEISKLVDSIKQDKWKWFIAMSLMSSQIRYADGILYISASWEFNYNKLATMDVVNYIQEKLEVLFEIKAEIKIGLIK